MFVYKIQEIKSSCDPDRPISTNPVEFSGTDFAGFQLVTEDTVLQEMPKKSCDLDPASTPVIYDCLDKIIPIVTNMPFLSKVLEPIVLKQFLQHLESHRLLEPFQSAYRKFHSTETALLSVVNDLLHASDSDCVTILSLLDLSSAFDTIDHNIIITGMRTIVTLACRDTSLPDACAELLSYLAK